MDRVVGIINGQYRRNKSFFELSRLLYISFVEEALGSYLLTNDLIGTLILDSSFGGDRYSSLELVWCRVLSSQLAFADGQGALVERIGLLVLPLVGVEDAQLLTNCLAYTYSKVETGNNKAAYSEKTSLPHRLVNEHKIVYGVSMNRYM